MIKWNDIDSVFLDMDGTLLDLHFDTYFWLTHLPERYADIKGVAPAEASETLLQLIKKEEGTLNWYCLDFWSDNLGVNIMQLKQEIQHLIAFRPHVKTFLQELQDTHHRVVLVTNAHNHSLNLKLSITGLDHYVDAIVCSHDLKLPKENPEFWDKLQSIEAFDKRRTMLIDDSLAVLKSAQTYGIQHIYSIAQPDSQKPPRHNEEFPSIDRFDRHSAKNS
ncbi:GMP/IMP nucleotidase [Alkalimarinus alittae]|uniref:GMP/IMP nucleotidase n=1 Tax=Alkalimarinus alittae TaxID=2961619 RepID=A0ABY6N390_9ALTE|nr:GMP/IMP nucleotidase [Alkalimarinus alittae]UZE96556.1 GMP/IMP nucleotidase [Alkalimarinus alittae]